jgi:chloramphenicol O-acetyltransferase type B
MFKLLKKLRDLLLVRTIWRKHQIGIGFHAGARVVLWGKNKLIIGDHFFIGRDSQILCDAVIGDWVGFSHKVGLIGTYDHNYQQIGVPIRLASQIRHPDYSWKGLNMKVVIEDDVLVGYGSIILSGVRIGQGSIIAAGSFVTRNVEPFSIYGGVPARKIGERFENETDLEEHIRLYNQNYKKGKE